MSYGARETQGPARLKADCQYKSQAPDHHHLCLAALDLLELRRLEVEVEAVKELELEDGLARDGGGVGLRRLARADHKVVRPGLAAVPQRVIDHESRRLLARNKHAFGLPACTEPPSSESRI